MRKALSLLGLLLSGLTAFYGWLAIWWFSWAAVLFLLCTIATLLSMVGAVFMFYIALEGELHNALFKS